MGIVVLELSGSHKIRCRDKISIFNHTKLSIGKGCKAPSTLRKEPHNINPHIILRCQGDQVNLT